MFDQSKQTGNDWNDWIRNLPVMRIFRCFRIAAQPGKLMLALAAIVAACLIGWLMDSVTPASYRAVINTTPAAERITTETELDAYVSGDYKMQGKNLAGYRNYHRQASEERVKKIAVALPEIFPNARTMEIDEILSQTAEAYEENLKKALAALEKGYEDRYGVIKKEYKEKIDSDLDIDKSETLQKRDRDKEALKDAYQGLFVMLINGKGNPVGAIPWIDLLIRENPNYTEPEYRNKDREAVVKNKKLLDETIQLAQVNQIASDLKGKGIFASVADYNARCFHSAVAALIWERDLLQVKTAVWQSLKSICWLVRFHPIYAIIFIAAWLVIWSIVGGAICRIAAMKIARDEQIGPVTALKFSMARFAGFFTAPLVPIGILVLIALLTALCSMLGAIPAVGEILVGLLFGLALVGGFIFALITIGLIGSAGLMFPAIAVEGSDSFDAISRSFSYLFGRPWRMGFYSLLAAVYGGICYLFVRFFAFLMLSSVHIMIGSTVNWDASSLNSLRGKLNAIWSSPTFADLNPSVNWASLGPLESVGAFLICLWVCLVVGLVVSFVVSFFFTANTTIYFLLRQREDATDIEDIYLEENVEELMAEEATEQSAAEPQPETTTPPSADAETPEEPTTLEENQEKPTDEDDYDKKE